VSNNFRERISHYQENGGGNSVQSIWDDLGGTELSSFITSPAVTGQLLKTGSAVWEVDDSRADTVFMQSISNGTPKFR